MNDDYRFVNLENFSPRALKWLEKIWNEHYFPHWNYYFSPFGTFEMEKNDFGVILIHVLLCNTFSAKKEAKWSFTNFKKKKMTNASTFDTFES